MSEHTTHLQPRDTLQLPGTPRRMVPEADVEGLSWFKDPTWGRGGNLDLARDYLAHHFIDGYGTLVEVGSLHVAGRVKTNGCSSAAWGSHAWDYDREFITIDADGPALNNAMALGSVGGFRVTPMFGWADAILPLLVGRRIVLLYLDGDNDPDAALRQLQTVEKAMVPGAVLLVDDAEIKGPRVREYVTEKGWPKIELPDSYQWGWWKP